MEYRIAHQSDSIIFKYFGQIRVWVDCKGWHVDIPSLKTLHGTVGEEETVERARVVVHSNPGEQIFQSGVVLTIQLRMGRSKSVFAELEFRSNGDLRHLNGK